MSRMSRKSALNFGEVLAEFFGSSPLRRGHNEQRVKEAWNEVSGAAAVTMNLFFRDGVLNVTISSSMARMQLEMNKLRLLAGVNEALMKDPLYIVEDGDRCPVKEIKLR